MQGLGRGNLMVASSGPRSYISVGTLHVTPYANKREGTEKVGDSPA